MLGIMMNPENASEFYAASKKKEKQQPSIFLELPDKPKISYLKDGRAVVNGKVKKSEESSELWSETLKRFVANRLRTNSISKPRSHSESNITIPLSFSELKERRAVSKVDVDYDDPVAEESDSKLKG